VRLKQLSSYDFNLNKTKLCYTVFYVFIFIFNNVLFIVVIICMYLLRSYNLYILLLSGLIKIINDIIIIIIMTYEPLKLLHEI
jgi:hypothetical protein